MSQQNVEIAERGVAALNETYRTGDIEHWRRHVEETFDPNVVLELEAEDAFTEGEWRGHEGAVGFVENQMEVLEDMWLRVDEWVYVDDSHLVMAITFGGRAQYTGLEVEMHPHHVFTASDRKPVRWQIFDGRERALEAVGLSA